MDDGIFYIVCCSQERDGGVAAVRRGNGGAYEVRGFTGLAGANYLVAAADGKHLYASGGDAEFRGYVAALRVGDDGSLTVESRRFTGGLGCCHLCLSPEGRHLYAANYRSGSVSGFAIGADGALGEPVEFDQHEGHGVNPERQEGPHAHFCGFDPQGKFLLVNDLGLDKIFAYPYDFERGIDVAAARITTVAPAGEGPRHLVFEPEGTCLLVTEMGNGLQRLAYDGGAFTGIAAVSTLPAGVTQPSKAAALRISPDGRFVLVSNRGYDSIAVFERKTLKFVSCVPSGGRSPRDFAFLADGRTVAAANEFEPNAVFFDFDAERGTLEPTGGKLVLARPLCVLPR
jgi:6-phosphogluconolactonase